MGILFWAVFCASFPIVLFYLIKRELPRLFPLNRNFWISILICIAATSLFILTHHFARSLIGYAAIVFLFIAVAGFLPRLPRRLVPWRDVLFTFLLGIAFFSPILADGVPRGPDTWAKPFLARSAAASIATVTEPGWEIGWMLGFDYTVYGAFSPVMSGIFSLVSGDHFAGVRLEMFTALIFLPPLAYLAGRRVGRNRWSGLATLIVLVSARIALGYIGISRFWAVALLPVLWLALWGWRSSRRGYAPLVCFLLAAAIFIHVQVGIMALLLFSGFCLEILWRRRQGRFKTLLGIIFGMAVLTTVWWQNILEASPVIYVAPELMTWNPGSLDHAWRLTLIILEQLVNPQTLYKMLPDVYSHSWYLGAFALFLIVPGLLLWRKGKQKRFGIFPVFWAGGLALLFNLPLFYSIPLLGDLTQYLSFPTFIGETCDEMAIGLQQRFLLLTWLAVGILAAKIWTQINRTSGKNRRIFLRQVFAALLTLIVLENLPFWLDYWNRDDEFDPRKNPRVLQVENYFKTQPNDEKVLYDLSIDYGGILQSTLNKVPVLQGWIASGYNYNFAFNYLWPLQVSVEEDPARLTGMLAAVGVRHYIMPNKMESMVLVAKMGRIQSSVHGAWLFAQIPLDNAYLSPARLIEVRDKSLVDYVNWGLTPWKAYTQGNKQMEAEEEEIAPGMTVEEEQLRRAPNRVEIGYTLDKGGVLVCNLAYQPALEARLDGKPVHIAESLANGLIWFESPAGTHTMVLFRKRGFKGFLALIGSGLAFVFCQAWLIFTRKSAQRKWAG